MHAYFLCLAAFVLFAKRAHSEEVRTNLEFVFLGWQNPTEFDAVAMTLKKPEKQQGQCLTVSSDKGQLCGLITWVTID